MKGVSSTRLGSTMMIRIRSGALVNSKEATIALMQTLLPLPVAPAMRRWGSPARSDTTGSPAVSSPSATGSPPAAAIFWKGGLSVTDRSTTVRG